MVKEVKVRLNVQKGRGLLIYLPKKMTEDSAFPFKPREEVIVRIEGDKLIITRE